MRRPGREVYRVYDEHAFLAGAVAHDSGAAQGLPMASERATRCAAVLALLLGAGAACVLAALARGLLLGAPARAGGASPSARVIAARPLASRRARAAQTPTSRRQTRSSRRRARPRRD
ncbi:MAG TPA: hypothetical protein VG366_00475, partial [Solirubrobacteraceae bacterium]|nr:hypothetical protein [Solirubrobacteraceae bacterium]